jgi:pimeloyl-ACP methyl ester carboxylesterase
MPRSRPLHILLAGVIGLTAWTPATAAAGPPDDGLDGSRPRPGYMIVLPELDPLPAGGGETSLFTGINEHAGYAVEVPPQWNGDLVLWAHGFRGNGADLTVDAPPYGLRERFVAQGYAWAASSYDRNGYDVASGVRSTAALAKEFAALVAAPERTYLAGVSMGGHVVARALEEHPDTYAGALPMCGVLGDHELFDYFLDYQLVAGALAGVPAHPAGPDYATAVLPRIYAALGLTPNDPTVATPAAQQLRAATVLDSGGPRPGADVSFAYWKDFLFDLGVPDTARTPVEGVAVDPGLVAGNVGTDYAPDEPADLDTSVQRVAVADERTRESDGLTPVAQVFGTPDAPVLSLHDLGDLFVPFSMEQVYAAEVHDAGRGELLVQRAIRATGHCEFSQAEAGRAWDDLVAWVEHGTRPEGDDVTDPKGLADPAFGCRFSDAAAYAAAGAPSENDTRRLFEPCP